MPKIVIQPFQSPVGELLLGSFEDKLCLCDWTFRSMRGVVDHRIQKGLSAEFVSGDSSVIQETISQLGEYFKGERKEFNIPTLLIGTDFQKQVWAALMKIPYGETRTYLQLSKELGNPDANRAVASANGANALSILIPCHRIIGSDGSLVGYAGGLGAKKQLLKLEKARISPGNGQLAIF
ncbi:methylated-DNA--[protein]-cysteine S-methyltransferase [Algoriphagus sp. CAU 1675]|uniref:methylated-DNA--[protein]-cysteine S-methyltransferase n=1 Tax=Algoriphagus sp. CAU 1675 TaxID=3032597 RepID=UPI0023DC30E1|nr:methylated-DNA--[protein]-cysteine S-methyltransferase [Algoriphagus sp. CAU 1675]MDF2157103.1 methylated-DNA--[protein]-cysteine S-methyltransferase [Algoriphagus sp. CAU 1675]